MPNQTRTTFVHQWITIIGIPVGLAFLGWAAIQADQARFDIHDLKNQVGWMQQSLGRHTTQLQEIDQKLGIRP